MTRTEKDGTLTVLADNYEGRKLNSPNDLSIDSKGRIYFTDPRYGRMDTMEIKDEAGQLVEGVYRIDAPGKITRILTHEVERPNGILVSADEKYLYVADNYNNRIGGARKLYRFDLRGDGTVAPNSRKVTPAAACRCGHPRGERRSRRPWSPPSGSLVTAAAASGPLGSCRVTPSAVHTVTSTSKLLVTTISLPEPYRVAANLITGSRASRGGLAAPDGTSRNWTLRGLPEARYTEPSAR